MLRTYLAFEAPIAAGPEREAPGREIAEALAQRVSAADPDIKADRVDQHSSYGWQFELSLQGVRVWCMLQLPGYSVEADGRATFVLVTEARRSFFSRLVGGEREIPEHRRICEVLDGAARATPGVTNARWYTRDEYLK